MNLNKNQRKFFIAAINHYGEESKDVRLKDLSAFAKHHDLIMPTSALKNMCQEEGLVRGHYNLLLTGIKPEVIVPDEEPVEMPTFKTTENVIVETSAFVEPPPVVYDRKLVKPYKVEPGQKKKTYSRPVYVVSDGDGNVNGVYESPKSAFDIGRKEVLHDNGLMSYEDFVKRMEYVGGAIIPSANSNSLHCLIEVMEIK